MKVEVTYALVRDPASNLLKAKDYRKAFNAWTKELRLNVRNALENGPLKGKHDMRSYPCAVEVVLSGRNCATETLPPGNMYERCVRDSLVEANICNSPATINAIVVRRHKTVFGNGTHVRVVYDTGF